MTLGIKIIRWLFLLLFFYLVLNGKMMVWLSIFGFTLIGSIFFGRFFCGNICPMNTVMVPTAKFARKRNFQVEHVPQWLQSKALPWVMVVAVITIVVGSKFIWKIDIPMLLLLMVLAIVMTLIFEPWVFHNHICPFGALQKLTGRWAKYSYRVHQEECIGCRKCLKDCPSQAISLLEGSSKVAITTSLCHQCSNCHVICPKTAVRYCAQ